MRQSAGDDPVGGDDVPLHVRAAPTSPSASSRRCARVLRAGPAHGRHRGAGRARRRHARRWATRWSRRSPANRSPPETSALRFVSPLLGRAAERTEETPSYDEGRTDNETHGIRRLARHGRLGADAAHARGGRLRHDRAGVLLDVATRAATAPAIGARHAAAAATRTTRRASTGSTPSSPARAATRPSTMFPRLRAAGWNGYWIDAASDAAHAATTR